MAGTGETQQQQRQASSSWLRVISVIFIIIHNIIDCSYICDSVMSSAEMSAQSNEKGSSTLISFIKKWGVGGSKQ